MNKPVFIAEIKTQSMYGFKSVYSRNTLIDCALQHGDWISVHTDPRFGGSFNDIYLIKNKTNKPVLAKGFHCHNDDVKKAIDLGADYVLIVDRYTSEFDPKNIIFEIGYNQFLSKQLWKNSVPNKQFKVLYNGRDLDSGLPKKYIGDYLDYRKKCHWVCGASLLRKKEDVQLFYPKCDAFIVGEHLMEFVKS